MARRLCIAFDQRIDTDRPIPGALDVAPGDAQDATLRIEWRSARDRASSTPLWALEGDALWFSPQGVARYRCTARGLTVIPATSASLDDVTGLLVATALPAMLWLQGAFVLHASAIVPADGQGALALAGVSGIGKSTLAAAFLDRGAHLVADDSIAIRVRDGAPVCSGLPGGYHLGDHESARVFRPVLPASVRRSAWLDAIVVLDETGAPPSRLDPVRAVETLLANRHRPNAARHAGIEPAALGIAAFLARHVPVYRWPRTDAVGLLDGIVRRTIMRRPGED